MGKCFWVIVLIVLIPFFLSIKIGIILDMIIVILFLLSVVLLYNLLLISVETKTYEMGVLRVLGFNKIGVICLILI